MIFGGSPAFAQPRHVGRPNIGDRDRFFELLGGALDRRWLSNGGPLVREFEARVAEIAGVRHSVATCNATAALELAIRAAGLHGEVIAPAFTFPATVHAIGWLGLTPVLCDVEPETGNIDPKQVRRRITPRTSGIIGVHLWGRPCAAEELTAIAEEHGLALILDAAQAFGARYRDRPVGGHGTAEVFSFHATKLLNTFEGGALVTNDGALAARARAMQNFGIVGEDEVALPGTNAKMSEAAAAMGLASLAGIDDLVARNRRRYEAYRERLAGIPGVELVAPARWSRPSYHYVLLRVHAERAGLTRDQLMALLRSENVIARRYFYPGCHRTVPYFTGDRRFPHTDRLAGSLLAVPTGAAVTVGDVDRIAGLIRLAVRHATAVAARLRHPAPATPDPVPPPPPVPAAQSPVPADEEATECHQPGGSHP